MKRAPSTDDPDAPAELAALVDSARVVVFRSGLSDTRALEAWLARNGVDHRVVTMGMGAAAERERFHRLRAWTGWNLLPLVFVRGRFVGGADEFFAQAPDIAGPGTDPATPRR